MTTDFTLEASNFSAEFANFIAFLGPTEIEQALNKVTTRLRSLPVELRALYHDRYFFHRNLVHIAEGPIPFQLDISDLYAVRAATLIAGVNRMRNNLSSAAAFRFKSTILGLLRPDRDIRQLEHETRTFVHFNQRNSSVILADLEGFGRFDMACTSQSFEFEVECKTVTEDTGASIKTDLLANLSHEFLRFFSAARIDGSGVYVLNFKRPTEHCLNVLSRFREALEAGTMPFSSDEFELVFHAKPQWTILSRVQPIDVVRSAINDDLGALSGKYFATKQGNAFVGLALLPHKPSTLNKKLIGVLKDACDQCSGKNPSLVWLHFVGHSEAGFLQLANFSKDGRGAGLNAVVSKVLHPRASTTDRSHIHTIRFSAEADQVSQKPIFDKDRLLRTAKALDGPCYDVPNPFSRFKDEFNF